MEKISLYIAGKKVDLDNNSFILFNYTMEDLSNPTIVKNSFSKQITLKGTPANNEIFGNLYRADRRTIFGDGYTGVAFDPLRKTPFAIYNEMNEVVESGYVKVDSVNYVSGGHEYKITLYGGLGSFFYGLMYNENGEKRSLYDLRYLTMSGTYTSALGWMVYGRGYDMVKDAWAYLASPETYDAASRYNKIPDIINFAPMYQGLPDKFDADKALVDSASFGNLPTLLPKTGTSSNLMVFENAHTEWEVKDLRWYLQRPVFRVKALFEAIADPENNGGYRVELDERFFNSSNHYYWDAWMLMPKISSDNKKSNEALSSLLEGMQTPADYLISFAKLFGLVFIVSNSETVVRIETRDAFYGRGAMIDITERVDAVSIVKTPILATSRFYQFGGAALGEWAEKYKAAYGVGYGLQIVDTGNDFNKDKAEVTKDVIFKGGLEIQERGHLYVTSYDTSKELLRMPFYEKVVVQQWSGSGSSETMTESAVSPKAETYAFFNNTAYSYYDWLPKVQLHEADNKSIEGGEMLLLYNGTKRTPKWDSNHQLQYRLTDDTKDMNELNGNTPCWNLTSSNSTLLVQLPSFRICHTDDNDMIDASLEWGEVRERAVKGVQQKDSPATLYADWWKNYLSDRYDVDTGSIKCKVNLSGMQVGQELMRNFFFYENAIWVLNKISNHSITTDDLTECEFIKVKDIKNYTQGQKL